MRPAASLPAVALVIAAATVLAAGGCATVPSQPRAEAWSPDQPPAQLAAAVARADAGVAELRKRLLQRINEEIANPPRAVAVCRDEAPRITAEVAAAGKLELGRTSHRLRNGASRPPAWAASYVAAAAGKKAAEVKPVAVDLGDRIGILRPIPTMQGCLRCHGPRDGLAPGVAEALSAGYPADQATGFAEGELRGWFWAVAKKE